MRGKNRRMGTSKLAEGADKFAGRGGGNTARYMVRWLSTRGEAGSPVFGGPQQTKFAAAKRLFAACQGWSETATVWIGRLGHGAAAQRLLYRARMGWCWK